MLRKVPLIVILGSTGTGKTKLSLELAERFGGEVISADSMQVYPNLDVVTAKATKEEQAKAPHHLLDVASPSDPFTVVHFRNLALPIINELELEKLPSDKLHARLKQIDSITADRLHPNNKRKIIRALEVFQETGGVPLSAILNEQRNRPGGNRLGGPQRYPHTILFWLQCNQIVLDERLDKRVDSMLEQGLLKEIRNFYNEHLNTENPKGFTTGVLQTIGFKEFIPYLEKFNAEQDLIIENYLKDRNFVITDDINDTEKPEGLDLLKSCLDELKLVTRRYSKKQIKWVRNRFLGSKDRQVPPLYGLDTTDVSNWQFSVYNPAVEVVESYMNEKQPQLAPLQPLVHPSAGLNEEVTNYCEVCKRHFIGEFQWKLHLKSNKHKRVKDSHNRKKKTSKLNTK